MDYIQLMQTPPAGPAPEPTDDKDADLAARAEYRNRQATYEAALAAVVNAVSQVQTEPTTERAQKEVVRSLQLLDALGEDRIAAELWPVLQANPIYRRYLDPEGYEAERAAAEAARIAEEERTNAQRAAAQRELETITSDQVGRIEDII